MILCPVRLSKSEPIVDRIGDKKSLIYKKQVLFLQQFVTL